MELVILGSSASSPAAGDACAGYLVRQGSTQLLLDCGSGVLSRLLTETTVAALSAIVISHFHPDHYLDLIPMRYGIEYGAGTSEPDRPLVLVPPGGGHFLERLGVALRNSPRFCAKSFEIVEFRPAKEMRVGDLALTFQRTTHDEPTWACRVGGEAELVYTADTQVSSDLERFAAGADLLLCEATYPADLAGVLSANHLTSRQAGQLAKRAGVRQLVLTHFWPGIDRARFSAEAERAYGASVTLAQPGLCLPLTTPANGAVHDVLDVQVTPCLRSEV